MMQVSAEDGRDKDSVSLLSPVMPPSANKY